MKDEYCTLYNILYKTHWWWRARERILMEEIAPLLSNRVDPLILDVGCGDGLFFDKLKDIGIPRGIEMNPELVSDDNPWRDNIFLGAFEEYRSKSTFDIILLLDVIEHIDNDKATIAKACELLKRDGFILITVPAYNFLWTRHDEINEHKKRYSMVALNKTVENQELRLHKKRYLFPSLTIPKLFVKTLESLGFSRNISLRVPPSSINLWLEKILYYEDRVLRNIPHPIGSSLLAIYKRS